MQSKIIRLYEYVIKAASLSLSSIHMDSPGPVGKTIWHSTCEDMSLDLFEVFGVTLFRPYSSVRKKDTKKKSIVRDQ